MRTSTIVLSALLGAGALAHPTLHNLHLHLKRGEWKEIQDWNQGNVHYEKFEYVDDASAPSAPAPKPQTESKNKVADAKANVQAQPTTTSPPVQSSTPPPSNQGSSGNSVLDTVNSMRAQWIPSLKDHPFAWSDQLASNVQETIDGAEDGGKVMQHPSKLPPGTFGQVLAQGQDGQEGLQNAMLMWMCEEPQGSIPCNSGNENKNVEKGGTGHADILKNTQYTKIACKFSVSVWTCDLGW